MSGNPGWWQQWLQQPQKTRLHRSLFQVHFWIGSILGAYVTVMGLTGSIIVFQNQLEAWRPMRWIVKLHANLLAGSAGRFVNGISGISLMFLCVTGAIIWWPGVKHWRRSIEVNWRANFPRLNWDMHSALGFWLFPMLLLWGLSGTYLAIPQVASMLYAFDPADRYADQWLSWLADLHFGRFNPLTEALWAALGLAPALLAFTGIFICCRRIIFRKPSNPYQ